MERDNVRLEFEIHELDFVSVLRAARLIGTSRDNIIRQAIGEYLTKLQRQGLDVGIRLPEDNNQVSNNTGGEGGGTDPATQKPGDGSGSAD